MTTVRNQILDILYFGYPLRSWQEEQLLTATSEVDDESLEALNRVFLTETERLLGNQREVIVPLSGGLDSRLILACLLECLPASKIHAFNYGVPGNLDFEIPVKIANATGIQLVQTDFRDIRLEPQHLLDFGYTLDTAPSHNLIGYALIKALSANSLAKMDLDPALPIWSGFLGDRVFNEKWKGIDLPLADSARLFVDSYCINPRFFELGQDYDPAKRLEAIYGGSAERLGGSWIECMEYHQRQYRVRRSLQTLPRHYAFLFEQPRVIAQIRACGQAFQKRGDLQAHYFHRFYPQLAALPVTSRSGYPLRQHEWQTRLDRVVRLSKNRIGSLPGMHSLKYRNVKISPHLLSSRVAGYDESIRAGFAAANQTLKLLSIDLDHPALQSFQQSRLGTEQLASLGYLHIPS